MAKSQEQPKNNTPQEEAAQPVRPAAPQPRPCPQDCRQCSMSQQIFCTTKMLFDLSRAQQVLAQKMEAVENAVADIQTQLQPKEQDSELALPFAK